MAARLRETGGIMILDIDGNIDINSSDIVEMVGWLVNTGKLNIILNFENVDFVDYSGLSILAIAYKNVSNHKGKMKFLHVPLHVIELFKVVKLDGVFENYLEENAAIASFFREDLDKLHLRRKFQRLDIHLRVRYKLVSDRKNPRSFEGDVLNMSGAGIYIYTPYTLPINSVLDLEFMIPGSASSLSATGRVIWLTDKDLQPHSYPGMGVSFAHLTPAKEKAIIDFIEKNVTHRAESSGE